MTHAPLPTLTLDQLAGVTGGFLPLLGMLGMGANLATSIMGAVGKKSEPQQAAPAPQPAAPAPAAPAAGNLLAQPVQVVPSGGCCNCGGSSSSSSSS